LWLSFQPAKAHRLKRNRPVRHERQYDDQWLPAHKRTLSRAELDRQELARIEGMDNYSKYRMQKKSAQN